MEEARPIRSFTMVITWQRGGGGGNESVGKRKGDRDDKETDIESNKSKRKVKKEKNVYFYQTNTHIHTHTHTHSLSLSLSRILFIAFRCLLLSAPFFIHNPLLSANLGSCGGSIKYKSAVFSIHEMKASIYGLPLGYTEDLDEKQRETNGRGGWR